MRPLNSISQRYIFVSRGSYISPSWFACGSSILVELEFGNVVFCGGTRPENPEKNPRSKARTSNKLKPHMTQAGEGSHHCAIATLQEIKMKVNCTCTYFLVFVSLNSWSPVVRCNKTATTLSKSRRNIRIINAKFRYSELSDMFCLTIIHWSAGE